MVRKSSILMLVVAVLFLAGCKSKKVVEQGIAPAEVALIKSLPAVSGTAESYSATAKLAVEATGKSISSSGRIKVKEGEGIQIGITPLGLFEAACIDFRPGDLTYVNKMKGEYARVDYNAVPLLAKCGINYELLESVMLGRVFLPQGVCIEDIAAVGGVSHSDGLLLLTTERDDIRYSFYIDSTVGTLVKSCGERKGGITVTCVYGDFTDTAEGKAPTRIIISLDSPSVAATLTLSLSKIKTPATFKATTLSPSYKRVLVGDLLKELGIK